MNRLTIEPARLLGLATAMGLAARLDDTGGYGVVRVVLEGGGVFNPLEDGGHGWEVLNWLDRVNDCFTLGPGYVAACFQRVNHNGTPTDLRRAVVEAACRVAKA